LPIASQNAQYYLQASYGLACAVARAEMALFVRALSFAVRSVGGVVFAIRSIPRRRLLRFGPLGALSLRFDPFRGVSFAV
jgi:hypothetical protein